MAKRFSVEDWQLLFRVYTAFISIGKRKEIDPSHIDSKVDT